MTERQKREYKLYRKECRVSNVESVLADFLSGEIPSCVRFHLELQKQLKERIQPQSAMAAAVGA